MDDYQRPYQDYLQLLMLEHGESEPALGANEILDYVRNFETHRSMDAERASSYMINIGGIVIPVYDLDYLVEDLKKVTLLSGNNVLQCFYIDNDFELLRGMTSATGGREFGTGGTRLEYVKGVAKIGKHLSILLDTDKLVSFENCFLC